MNENIMKTVIFFLGITLINPQLNAATIVLSDDKVVSGIETFTEDTVIVGHGFDIIFEDEGCFKVDGPAGTTLTLRNCNVKGVSDYDSGNSSIMFGAAADQALILNDVVFNLADDFEFSGGGLGIKNKVEIKGFNKVFYYSSVDDIYINNASTLLFDLHVIFAYIPSDSDRNHIIMESDTSNLFLNGCIIDQGDASLGDASGLELTGGHLIVDHIVKLYNSGKQDNYWSLTLGDKTTSSNLKIDILPSANFDVVSGKLSYANVDSVSY